MKHSVGEFRAILGVAVLNLALSGIGVSNYVHAFRAASAQSIPFPAWAPFYWTTLSVGIEGVLATVIPVCSLTGRIAAAYNAAVALLLLLVGHILLSVQMIVAGPIWISCLALGWFLFIATLLVRIVPKSSMLFAITQWWKPEK